MICQIAEKEPAHSHRNRFADAMDKTRPGIFPPWILAIVLLLLWTSTVAARNITVGIYDNKPLIFSDELGKAKGIYADLLHYMAEKEGWQIQYIHGSWEECLERLDQGDIDLLTAIGFSQERQKRIDYSRISVLDNWGQVFANRDVHIRSAVDLNGKPLAVVKSEIYYDILIELSDKFDIHPRIIEADSSKTILEMVENQKVDAGLVSRIYGTYHLKDYNIHTTPVRFGLNELRFAAPKGRNASLLTVIDRHMESLKGDKRSIYYQSLNLWLEDVKKVVLPKWLNPVWILAGVASILLVLFLGNMILRWQVRVKSRALEETLAAKHKIESELQVARDIQMSFMPGDIPNFPGYDVQAWIQPAKEVGGDFYDVFTLDNEHLCFVLADVSGKGVPAALFMAKTQTLVNSLGSWMENPADLLHEVNAQLMIGNDECMFVTLFIGIVDLKTDRIRFTNAGHNAPVFISENGTVEFLEGAKSTALGINEDSEYAYSEMTLQKGDTLFIYTDGVTEAFNVKEEMFSDDRLISELSASRDLSPEEMVARVRNAVMTFAGDREQFDDITMLAIKRL